MIHFDERFLTVHWDQELAAVKMEWKGYAEGEGLRRGLDAGLALLRKKHANRWLADLRLLGPLRQEDQNWTNSDWFPRAIAGGVRFMALVQPQSLISRMSVRKVMSKVNDHDLITANFEDIEAARAWLKKPV